MVDGLTEVLEAGTLDPVEREAAALARGDARLAMAHELAEIGMRLARRLVDGESPGGDVGLAYSRISRAVRMTLALEALIEGEAQGLVERLQAGRKARAVRAEEDRLERARAVVRDSVRRAVEADADRWQRGERAEIFGELEGLLDDEDELEALGRRPLCEAIAFVCHELGVPFDAALWVDPVAAAVEVVDRADRPDGLDRVLEVAVGGWPAGPGKPRPPD